MEILTAEEFLDFDIPNQSDYEHAISQAIKFAKAHVEAALKAASEKAQGYIGAGHNNVKTESILLAYPLENIK